MSSRISYVKPSIGERELANILLAARDGWGDNSNKFIDRFEEDFSRVVEVPYAVATSSCTGALELGLAALDIGDGDEVILADTNWVATLAPIVHRGSLPVFVDILEDTWCIDPDKVVSKITAKTKAIIATHLYGNLADMNALSRIAKAHGLYLIEDSAEALGSYYYGSHAGTIGDFGVFSFHGSKTVTTGEGGMLVTRSGEIATRVRQLNNHGRSTSESRQFFSTEIGYKFKMTNMQAAIGSAQLERFDELVRRKREILNCYRTQLLSIPHLTMNPLQVGCESGAWMPNVTFSRESGVTRNELLKAFSDANIDARVFFWPLSTMGLTKNESNDSPISASVAERSINLPSFHDMSESDISRVVSVIRNLSKTFA